MRTLTSLLLICIAILAFFAVFVFARTQIGREEHPPCSACSEPRSELPSVSVCDLPRNPERHVGMTVRVEARFRHDSGQLFLETLAATFTLASRRNGIRAGDSGEGYRFVQESEIGMTAAPQYVRQVPSQSYPPIIISRAKWALPSFA